MGLVLATNAAAWAQEGEGAGHGAEGGEDGGLLGSLGIHWKTVLVQAFAFILLYLLFRKFLWGPLLDLLDSRQREVTGLYAGAEEAKATADTMRRDYEERLARADEESRERIATALNQASQMKEEIINSAREQADRIVTAGRDSVRQEAEKAQVQVRDTAARMAVEVAGKIIQREMDPSAQRALVDQFIDSAGNGAGGAGGAGRPQ
jgi:F-type H+-transporting ATPase subunit b